MQVLRIRHNKTYYHTLIKTRASSQREKAKMQLRCAIAQKNLDYVLVFTMVHGKDLESTVHQLPEDLMEVLKKTNGRLWGNIKDYKYMLFYREKSYDDYKCDVFIFDIVTKEWSTKVLNYSTCRNHAHPRSYEHAFYGALGRILKDKRDLKT
uniref:Uncharacterized protein n=1 Tax=viral metagenome TaxID=1070528 RepID=A0A6H1ZW92_9ZZZZ